MRLFPVTITALTVLLASLLAMPPDVAAQSATAVPAKATTVPPGSVDPWPRDVSLNNAAVLMYSPQVMKWEGNQITFRSAIAIKPSGAKDEAFGVLFATARTDVDRVERTVVFEDLKITKSDFPTLPDNGAAYVSELQTRVADGVRTISLDRLESSLAISGVKMPAVPVRNVAPQVIVSYSPAILVPIDGAPVLKPAPSSSRFQRVINTRALILQGGFGQQFYIHVYDGWLSSSSINGPWTQSQMQPLGMDDVAKQIAKSGVVDMLDGGPGVNPKPSLSNGVPTIYTPQSPTELITFTGQPDFVPIVSTPLLWASNTTSDVFVDTTNSAYYILLAGRWFTSTGLTGPWTFVASDALPSGFAQIPKTSLAGAVLPAVAGTQEAREAVIENSIPQTASVKRVKGPTFTPNFDGAPQYSAIPETPLSYVVNSSTPIIQVDPASYYAIQSGVWFNATALTGPWGIATTVPAVIYTIPVSSPLHYVTYAQIYSYTPQFVYVGYTPGYLGTVVGPYGTVVYGTGYAYAPWIGSVWYPPPYTYGVAAVPVYNAAVGFTFGFAMGLATAAWTEPYWGGAYYHPAYWGAYPCCGSASANVYGQWGNTTYSGTRSWYAGGGVAGTSASGSYYNNRTGTSGSYNAGRQYNAYTGNATRAYDRTGTTAAGGSGNVARAGNYNTYTGQRSTGSSVNATGADGSSYNRTGATTAGPMGDAHAGGGSTYNARTGTTNTWNTASVGDNHYADVNGNTYKNTGDGWQQHSSSGWGSASGDTSGMDKESQARTQGADRSSAFSGGGFGGGGGFHGFGGGGGGFSGFGGGRGFGGGGFGGGGFGGGGFRGGGGRR
jgi:hypothetical protein